MKNLRNKTLQIAALIAFTIATISVNASNGEDKVATEKTITEHVKFPRIIIPTYKTEKVEVIFTTGDNGHVNFVLAKTENDFLKKELEKQFKMLHLDKLKSDVAYSIIFNFKTI